MERALSAHFTLGFGVALRAMQMLADHAGARLVTLGIDHRHLECMQPRFSTQSAEVTEAPRLPIMGALRHGVPVITKIDVKGFGWFWPFPVPKVFEKARSPGSAVVKSQAGGDPSPGGIL